VGGVQTGAVFVLVHSPLVGPFTWTPVATALRQAGHEVVVPVLEDLEYSAQLYWQQHVTAAARTLRPRPDDHRLILVGHSGAGPLLPAMAQAARHPVAAYIFVDAGIPTDGASRLDLMAQEAPAWAAEFRAELAAGGVFPTWTDDDLRALVPDADWRRALLAELRPRSLAFFWEPIRVFAGWPDAPCAYLQFSAAYDAPAAQARRRGWAYRQIDAGHFHMLVDPAGVADALLALAEQAQRA
jgi:pimeloyl-ACP methyl ester carboxylesterase